MVNNIRNNQTYNLAGTLWVPLGLALLALALLTPVAHADTQYADQQLYLARTEKLKWPKELPKDKGVETIEATINWISRPSACGDASWIKGAKKILEQPDASQLPESPNAIAEVREMEMDEAVRVRECIDLLVAASEYADDGSVLSQKRHLALMLYLGQEAPLLEARSVFIHAALKICQDLYPSSEDVKWVEPYAKRATKCFDQHLDYLTAERRLVKPNFDLAIALRRIAAETTQVLRWTLGAWVAPTDELELELELESKLLSSIAGRLDKLVKSPEVSGSSFLPVMTKVAGQAGYIQKHLPDFHKTMLLRRDLSPVIDQYLKAISDEDRELLKAVSLPSQVEALGNQHPILKIMTGDDAVTSIKIDKIKEVQWLDDKHAKAEVRTIIGRSDGEASSGSMTIILTLTEGGWRVGKEE